MTCLFAYMDRQISKCTDKAQKTLLEGGAPPPPPGTLVGTGFNEAKFRSRFLVYVV